MPQIPSPPFLIPSLFNNQVSSTLIRPSPELIAKKSKEGVKVVNKSRIFDGPMVLYQKNKLNVKVLTIHNLQIRNEIVDIREVFQDVIKGD